MNHKTYIPQEGITHLPQTLREFGERQNRLNSELQKENAALSGQVEVLASQMSEAFARIGALEKALLEANQRITELESEQALNIKRFHRCAEDLDKAERENERLRLTAKLNSNAIDRLVKSAHTDS